MKSRYKISYYLRIVLMVAVYIIFFGYIIYSIIKAKNASAVWFNIIIGFIFGGTGVLYEYLRICYDAATKRLIADGKPEETLKLLDRVERADFFKTYKSSCQMMRMLAMIDLREFREVLEYIKTIDTDEYDVEIVKKHSQMVAQGELGNKGKSNEAFKQLIDIRDMKNKKGRRFKGAFFFNWEVVNGQHKNYDKDYDAAYRYLSDINESSMNNREVMHYLLAKVVASRNTNHQEVYEDSKARLLKSCKENKVMRDYCEKL